MEQLLWYHSSWHRTPSDIYRWEKGFVPAFAWRRMSLLCCFVSAFKKFYMRMCVPMCMCMYVYIFVCVFVCVPHSAL